MEVLLAKDESNANAVNYKLHSVLHLADHRQKIRAIEVLLRHNVDVNAQVRMKPLLGNCLQS